MKTFVLILMLALMAATLVVMFAGVFGMGRGDAGARRSNVLMRWRVVFQFGALLTVLLLGLVLRS